MFKTISFFVFLYSIISFVIVGCKSDDKSLIASSNIPDDNQISKSEFSKFINELKSLSIDERTDFVNDFLSNNPHSPIIEDKGLASFYYYDKAKSVLINSDINYGWTMPDSMDFVNCGDKIFFYKIYSLPNDARIDYLFIVDSTTITDPRNNIITPSGFGLHSQCSMPLFKTKSIRNYRSDIQHGTIDSLLFESKLTNLQPRMLKIYMPEGYQELSELPVLFVNDGFKAIEYCDYINVLDNLIADKKIIPVIVVFIDFVEGDQYYFLSNTKDYFSALCDELVPLIDLNYKTSKRPEQRVLSGISAGGHISILTALRNPDVFLNAAGQSSTTTNELFNTVKSASINKQAKNKFKLYFDVGRFDLVQGGFNNYSFLYANQLLNKEMMKAEINHTFKIFNDGHQWANWRERIDEILIYFFGI